MTDELSPEEQELFELNNLNNKLLEELEKTQNEKELQWQKKKNRPLWKEMVRIVIGGIAFATIGCLLIILRAKLLK